MTTLCNVGEEVAEGSMKKATIGAKEYIAKNGVSEVPPEADLSKEKMAPVTKRLLQAHHERCCSLVKLLYIYFCYFNLLNQG